MVELDGFKWQAGAVSNMSTATKVVIGTIGVAAILSIAIVLNLAVAA